MERMTLQEAYEIAKRREPIFHVDGYGEKHQYKRITEVGIWIDEEGVGHPFVTLRARDGNSTIRTKLRQVERVNNTAPTPKEIVPPPAADANAGAETEEEA